MVEQNMTLYDFSDLAPEHYDFSDLAPKEDNKKVIQPMNQKPLTMVGKLAQSDPVQEILGFGDALQRPFYEAGNLVNQVIGQKTSPTPQTGRGLGYELGGVLGSIVPYGIAERAVVGSVEGLPMAEKIARRLLVGSSYGALMNPDHREVGALEGGALTGAFEGIGTIPYVVKALTSGTKNYADKIVQALGRGRSNTENLQELAQDIRNSGKLKQDLAKKTYYDPLKQKYGDSEIYPKELSVKSIEERKYNPKDSVLDIFNKKLSGDVMEAHEKFVQNPTFDNAHNLQSTLATAERSAYSPNASMEDTAALSKVRDARKNLLSDINNFISKTSPEDAALHKEGAKFYYNEVVPYKVYGDIQDIVSGNSRDVDLSRLPNILKKTSDVSAKISEDIGKEGRNKVLYHELAKSKNLTPEKISSILSDENLKASRLDQFAPEELSPLVKSLQNRIGLTNKAQTIGGAILGAHAVPSMGVLSALGGASLAPKAFKSLGDIGSKLIPESAKQYTPGIGNAIRQLLISNLTKSRR